MKRLNLRHMSIWYEMLIYSSELLVWRYGLTRCNSVYIYMGLQVLVPAKGPSVCGKISGSTSFRGALLMFWYKFIPQYIQNIFGYEGRNREGDRDDLDLLGKSSEDQVIWDKDLPEWQE